MTDYAMKYGKKTMREYVTHTMTGGSALGALPLIICAVTLAAIPLISLVGYFITGVPAMLIVTVCAVFFIALIAVVMVMLVNVYTQKMLSAFATFDGLVCSVSSEKIIIARDGAPQSVINWSSISEMHEGRYAYYLKTDDELLIILEKDNVLSGTERETSEIIAGRQGAKK